MVYFNKHLSVITGGPGAGKTALLEELQRRVFCCEPEVAREIIRNQVAVGGDALPWGNTSAYTQLMLEDSVAAYREHQAAIATTFFDRGIPDTLCYARLIRLSATDRIEAACATYRYNATVFVAPPWEEIYSTDTERKQSFEDAVTTYELMVETYRSCGYETMDLPRVSVEQRADLLIAHLSS